MTIQRTNYFLDKKEAAGGTSGVTGSRQMGTACSFAGRGPERDGGGRGMALLRAGRAGNGPGEGTAAAGPVGAASPACPEAAGRVPRYHGNGKGASPAL